MIQRKSNPAHRIDGNREIVATSDGKPLALARRQPGETLEDAQLRQHPESWHVIDHENDDTADRKPPMNPTLIAAENLTGPGSTLLTASDDTLPRFRLTVTESNEVTISGEIDQIEGWHMDNTPADFSPYLSFYMKRDGCCHLRLGDKLDDGSRNGYLHLCEAGLWNLHISLLIWLYKWAEEIIPMDKEQSGSFLH